MTIVTNPRTWQYMLESSDRISIDQGTETPYYEYEKFLTYRERVFLGFEYFRKHKENATSEEHCLKHRKATQIKDVLEATINAFARERVPKEISPLRWELEIIDN